jgi:hypothetical protein
MTPMRRAYSHRGLFVLVFNFFHLFFHHHTYSDVYFLNYMHSFHHTLQSPYSSTFMGEGGAFNFPSPTFVHPLPPSFTPCDEGARQYFTLKLLSLHRKNCAEMTEELPPLPRRTPVSSSAISSEFFGHLGAVLKVTDLRPSHYS